MDELKRNHYYRSFKEIEQMCFTSTNEVSIIDGPIPDFLVICEHTYTHI